MNPIWTFLESGSDFMTQEWRGPVLGKKKHKQGSFWFVVQQDDSPDVEGELTWFEEENRDRNRDARGAPGRRIRCLVVVHDENLDASTKTEQGVWILLRLGPVIFDIDSADLNQLQESGASQQQVLNSVIDRIRKEESGHEDEGIQVFNFNNLYGEDVKFTSCMKIWEDRKANEPQGSTLKSRVKRIFLRTKWRMIDLVNFIRSGKPNYVLAFSNAVDELKETRKFFRMIVAVVGIFLSMYIIWDIFYMHWKNMLVISAAALIGWAAREGKLVDDIRKNIEKSIDTKEEGTEYHFHRPIYWRRNVWKFIGYWSSSLGVYYVAGNAIASTLQ